VTRARDKANLTQKITTSEPTQLTDGMIWLDTDAVAVSQQNIRWTETPGGGVTVLTGTDDNSITLRYTVGQEQVYANGVLLIRGSDYTASNGTSITLASASVAGDVFEVISIIPLTLVDTYTQTQANDAFVKTVGGSTVTVASGTTVPLTIQNNGTGNSFVVNDQASDTTPFVIDASGNVGIGMTPTTRQLSVFHDTTSVIQLTNTASGTTSADGSLFYHTGTDLNLRAAEPTGGISLQTGGANARVYIDSTGNVGINTLTPTAKLDVNGSISSTNYLMAGKNVLINGNFDIWQRGTSFSAQPLYTADRWYNYQSANITVSRQSTNPPSGSQYVLRQTATAGGGYLSLHQYIETANVATLWGKTVTFSIKLRRSATFDATMFVDIAKTGTVDGGAGATWVQIATTSIGASSITSGTSSSDWTTLSVTAEIPADGTANGLYVRLGYLTNPANGSYIESAQAQLEVGSVVTPFSRAGGTIQGELAACQRYYCRWTGGAAYHPYGLGFATSTTAGAIIVNSPVAMRVAPTTIDYSTIYLEDYASASSTAGTVSAFNAGPLVTKLNFTGLSGMTAGRGIYIYSNNDANGYLAFSAEL